MLAIGSGLGVTSGITPSVSVACACSSASHGQLYTSTILATVSSLGTVFPPSYCFRLSGDSPSSSAARSWLIPVLSLALWYKFGYFRSIVFSSFPRYHVTIQRANGTMGMM